MTTLEQSRKDARELLDANYKVMLDEINSTMEPIRSLRMDIEIGQLTK